MIKPTAKWIYESEDCTVKVEAENLAAVISHLSDTLEMLKARPVREHDLRIGDVFEHPDTLQLLVVGDVRANGVMVHAVTRIGGAHTVKLPQKLLETENGPNGYTLDWLYLGQIPKDAQLADGRLFWGEVKK